MKRKVDVHDLQKGMYVSELDRPWLGTPFLFQGFEIRTDEELDLLRRLCQYVYVDTENSHAQPHAPARRAGGADATKAATPAAGRTRILEQEFVRSQRENGAHPPLYKDQTVLEEEIEHAREIERSSREFLFQIIDDVRLGRSLNTATARRVVLEMVESVIRNPDALVWLTHLKQKHEYTALHSLRVCILALTLGRHLDFPRDKLNLLGLGALLHDIGKLRVPVEILDKPERLTDHEFEVMKQHVPWGVEILTATSQLPAEAIEVVRSHHERYSGVGYVGGLKGDEITEFGHIGAIVDTYDAITSDRIYHAGLSAADALRIIYEGRTKAYHPWLVEQFIQCIGVFPIGSIVEMNTGSVGVVITVNRIRRLRPRVVLVLTADKQPRQPPAVIDLMEQPRDASGRLLEIKNVLPAGSYGINATAYVPLKY